jgi:Flp pilus assembly protein TadB
MEQERQRTEEWREEMLDWLHEQHQQQMIQTALLERIARHTGLIYNVVIVWLVLVGLGLVVAIISAASGSSLY